MRHVTFALVHGAAVLCTGLAALYFGASCTADDHAGCRALGGVLASVGVAAVFFSAQPLRRVFLGQSRAREDAPGADSGADSRPSGTD